MLNYDVYNLQIINFRWKLKKKQETLCSNKSQLTLWSVNKLEKKWKLFFVLMIVPQLEDP